MAIFQRIFEAFSARPESASQKPHDVPESTRTRVLLWCQEVFSNSRAGRASGIIWHGGGDHREEFWQEIHRYLQYRQGRVQLTQRSASMPDDAVGFLMSCSGKNFLDFLEDVFTVQCLFQIHLPPGEMVEELNEFLRKDNLPYHVTEWVTETTQETPTERQWAGHQCTTTKTLAFPKVIMRESELLHVQAIAPTLKLLQRPYFSNANTEYLAALEDYRKGDLGDCLTKCCSAFESVLKVICRRKGWPCDEAKDTCGTLVKTILSKTSLDPYFESMLLTSAVLRNKLSTSHGAGGTPRRVPRHFAHYALNATANAIVLVAEETGEG